MPASSLEIEAHRAQELLESSTLTAGERAIRDRMLVDFRFFCSKLRIRIKSDIKRGAGVEEQGALGPFAWNNAQRIVWAYMVRQMKLGLPIRLVILKARQFGISTFFCAWLFGGCGARCRCAP